MSKKLRNLAARREYLVAEASAQRLMLAENVETWRTPLALADRGLAIVHYIKRHPISAAGAGLGLLTVMQSSRASTWFQRGWLVWQVVRRLRGNHTK
jgi:YqjK-like protein